jgi:hypothetical protein
VSVDKFFENALIISSSTRFLNYSYVQVIMGKELLIFMLIGLLLIAGCDLLGTIDSNTTDDTSDPASDCPLEENYICGDDGLTYLNSCFSSARNVGVAYLGVCEYEVCMFNDVPHYVMNNMLFYEDDRGRPYIPVLYGTFYRNENDGWTYVKAINVESSYYSNRMPEYETGITESGNAVICEMTTEAPENLKEFLKTHGKIVDLKLKDENAQEEVSESTDETDTPSPELLE